MIVPGNHERGRIAVPTLLAPSDLHVLDRPRTVRLRVRDMSVAIGGFPFLVIATLIGAAKIIWAAPRASVPVIGDRMIGQMIALWALSGGLWFAGVAPHIFPYPGWIGAFVMFNLLIALPPISRLSARHVILDDVVAGGLAASVTLLAAGISHGWFG